MNYKSLYHIYLFSFGFLYYLILPFCVILTDSFLEFPGMNHLAKHYNDNIIFPYLLITICLLISFLLGSFLPIKTKYLIKKKTIAEKELVFGNRDLFLLLIPFFIYAQYLIFSNRSNLFQGYLIEYDAQFMGNIATFNTLFLFWGLYYAGKSTKRNHTLSLFFLFSIFEFSIVLLGLGSRMYILVPLISFLLFLLDNHQITIKKLTINACIIILLLLCVGVWRLGDKISLNALLYIGVAEPCLTWISAESMFTQNNTLPLFSVPSNFLSSFFNFIPSVLLPNKDELIQPITLSYESPFGATNLLLSLLDNFGILGSCLTLFIFGFLLSYIRFNANSLLSKTYYLCICGVIPFQLFRDNIAIINKILFYNFLLFPLVLIILEKAIYKKSRQIL